MSIGADAKATVGDISKDNNLNTAQQQFSRRGFCSFRHGMAFILQLCNFSIYAQQMNLSITISAMVNNTNSPFQPNASIEGPAPDSQHYWNETSKEFKAVVMVLTGQYSIWVKWAPPLERSQLTSIAASGSMLGSFITLLVGGLLCQTIGWPYVFYIFGGIGCACCLLWFLFIYDDPMDHPFISTGEKTYIMCSLAQQDCLPGWSLPIKAMIKSLPLWAILVSYFCEYWLFYTLMAYTPTYISSVLEVNLTDSGILSALPFAVSCICIILGGLLADFLLSKKILRLIIIRKLFTAIGVLFPSIILVSLTWVRSSHIVTMTFLVLSSAASSLLELGVLVNFLDIAPRYTGFLKGLSQVFAHIAGAISPTVAGFFIGQDSEFGWRNVFLLSAAINIPGLAFYLIFGCADVQDWAKEQMLTHL
ncbi:probable small intestine urate exporter isoform X2 [Nycticebus coucang]|uniref:probable small intestine urate exporter isoform X2 n=1 Tax=Nycticebus coucang TaxID=9470 RepID=UPI00234DD8DA|nr:probable small intestine urate exporter isoform X2 [Nycticebus coucang]